MAFCEEQLGVTKSDFDVSLTLCLASRRENKKGKKSRRIVGAGGNKKRS